jgi:8-oxo-dGTP pyrophosphatase MutT (NUDIX family)
VAIPKAKGNLADIPVRPAATVMVVDDRPDLHVLLLRRRAGSNFVGGMDVFPGGGVDPHDADPEVEAVCADLDDARASARLGLPEDGLAYWVAATRETFEEAGVLFARHRADGRALDPSQPGIAERLASERRAVDAGERRLVEVARDLDLQLTVDEMHYAAHWITPVGPPRRYDTRFFVTAMPKGQTSVPDRREAVDSAWVRPTDALTDFASGARVMLPPTVGMLRVLATYPSSEALIAAALRDETGQDERVRMVALAEGGWEVLLPGDPLSDAPADAKVHDTDAWIRLRRAPAEPGA